MNAKTPSYWGLCRGLLRYKAPITLGNIACNVMIFGHGTALSFLARQILNHLERDVQGQVLPAVLGLLAGIVLISLVRVAAIFGCAVLDGMRGYFYQNRIRLGIFRRLLQRQDLLEVAGSSGRIHETLDDDVPAGTFPVELLTEVAGHFLCTLVTLAILLSINWRVTLVVFLPLSAAILAVQRLSDSMKERRKASRGAHEEMSIFLGDVADSILSIKAVGAESSILKVFDQKNAARRKAVLRDAAFGAKVSGYLSASIHLGTAVMMCAFAGMIPGGGFKVGDFSIFVSSLFVLADCVSRIVELFSEYRKGEVSFERILSAAEGKSPLPEEVGLTLIRQDAYAPRPKSRPHFTMFSASGLSYAYGGGEGVHGVNLSLHPGELVAVAGGVGSGKSTLLHLLAGCIAPSAGSIVWHGEPGFQKAPPFIASAPQRLRFFSASIGENLCMGEDIGDSRLYAALDRAALGEAVRAMERGLKTQLGSRGMTLSGGQRQRLALARMYAHDPQISLIDDNVSALDGETQAQVLDGLLRHVRLENRAAVIATNSLSFLKAADRVLVMRNGRVQAQGKYAELAQSSEYLRSITR